MLDELLRWLVIALTHSVQFSHFHSYLEVAFGVNGIVAGWWDRIEPLVLKSKDEIQEGMEAEMSFMNDALTEELEKTKVTIVGNLNDGSHDTKIRKWGVCGRVVCMTTAVIIPMLLLLIEATVSVCVSLMGLFITIPLFVVASIGWTHRRWTKKMSKMWKAAVEDAKRKYEKKFNDAIHLHVR